ncbi:hypothetical protein [Micromonospora vulcania]|uniref:Sigma-70 region 2 n=1 Tax=Micromonospora vulcania TaxID=1441873 RepID=A0ABW1H170_9ACTN
MRWKRRFEGLDALVAERGSSLLATAVLLTGSRAAGEDLVQGALERLMRHWHRVHGDSSRCTLAGLQPPQKPMSNAVSRCGADSPGSQSTPDSADTISTAYTLK